MAASVGGGVALFAFCIIACYVIYLKRKARNVNRSVQSTTTESTPSTEEGKQFELHENRNVGGNIVLYFVLSVCLFICLCKYHHNRIERC